MLCSLLLLSKNVEGVLYNVIQDRMKEKCQEYEKLMFENIEEIYGMIESNIPDEYIFNDNSQIMIIDNINKKNNLIKLNEEQVKSINELDNLSKGCYVYDLQ